jgi:hypothetical protein
MNPPAKTARPGMNRTPVPGVARAAQLQRPNQPSQRGPALGPVRTVALTPAATSSRVAAPAVHSVRKHLLIQPKRPKAPSAFGAQRSIQLNPLSINVPGYQEWSRDTGAINIDDDIRLFQTKIKADNPLITSIAVRKKPDADHEVVVVGTADGIYVQMDIASHGAKLRYNINPAHYGIVVKAYTPNHNLRLHDVFRAFYNLSHAHAFHFENYSCQRFAADLARSVGTAQGAEEDFM